MADNQLFAILFWKTFKKIFYFLFKIFVNSNRFCTFALAFQF